MALPIDRIFGGSNVNITSGFGKRQAPLEGASTNHLAVDFGAPIGTPIRALASGKVSKIGYDKKSGHYLHIDHGNGYVTKHAHLQKRPTLEVGSQVKEGDNVAHVGNTGNSTGPHLHLALEKNGKRLDITKISDLEQHIRPTSNQVTTTAPAVTTTSTITTMANPEKQQSSAYLMSRKPLKDYTAEDIMRIGASAGSTSTDIKRAVKGLEDLKKRGYDINVDAESGTFKVTGPNGGVINPSKKGAGNVKGFDIGDVVGAGRNVNYLAGILAKRPEYTEPAPSASKSEPVTAKSLVTPVTGLSEFLQNQKLKPTGYTPTKPEVLNYEPVTGIDDEALPRGLGLMGIKPSSKPMAKEEGQTESKINQTGSPKSTGLVGKFERLASMNHPYAYNQYIAKEYASKVAELVKANPNANKEEISKMAFDDLLSSEASQNTQDMIDALLTVGSAKGIQLAPSVIGKGVKYVKNIPFIKNIISKVTGSAKAASTGSKAVASEMKMLPEAKISRMARERATKYNPSSGETIVTPPSQQTTAKELLKLPPSTIGNEMGVVRKVADKYVPEITKALKSNPNSKSLVLKDGTRVRLKKGGWESYEKGGIIGARDLVKRAVNDMGVPRYQRGNKMRLELPLSEKEQLPILSEDVLNANNELGTKVSLDAIPSANNYQYILPDKNKDIRFKPQNLKDTRSGSGKGKQWLKDNAGEIVGTAALTAAPILAQQFLKMKKVAPISYRPIELGALAPKDLPRPQLINISPSTRTLSSDVRQNQLTEKFAEAQNKSALNQWGQANAMQKRQAEAAGIDASNRAKMFNAQLAMSNVGRNQYLDFQRDAYNAQNMQAATQAAFGNLNDRLAWNRYANTQTQASTVSDIIKNPNSYSKEQVDWAKSKLGMPKISKNGMKLTPSNLLKK